MSTLPLWLAQAIAIAIVTSVVLNSALFIPYFRRKKIARIDARAVGFSVTFAAFFLWCYLNPSASARDCALPACLIIVATVVGPNYLVHKCRGDDDDNGVRTIQFEFRMMTPKGAKLLEERIEERLPDDPELAELFRIEQLSESPLERYEDAMIPKKYLWLLDETVAFIVKAWRDQPTGWLLTAAADAVEARQGICTARNNLLLFYKLYWPQHAA